MKLNSVIKMSQNDQEYEALRLHFSQAGVYWLAVAMVPTRTVDDVQ